MEKVAAQSYLKLPTEHGHVNLELNPSGLILSEEHVFLGASPDFLVQCDCCGLGLVEIKSPFTLRTISMKEKRPDFLDE